MSVDNLAQASGSNSGRKYGMVIDNTKCIGCGLCQKACRTQWDMPPDETFIQLERDYVGANGVPEHFTSQCNHCENPPCAKICPTTATYLNEDGILVMDNKKCIACKGCMAACPYNARFWSYKWKTPEKCRFCDGYVQGGHRPACVIQCPVEARVFGDLNDPNSEISKVVASENLVRLREELGTEPKIYYKRK
ncbi:4Fe-4S ferredoxin [Desulfuribacillus alkaliarsenatis]|uniref:4Fe-4S ferredoxin n=2 Tax=Desulfuribacillus alkaliarsenatis TaxID=766136 RepID=A0A1E5G6H1_9FIRM|nr:4Fe-4S ferredoxin [Desulfuribacillus alkaliarsenatis]